MTHPMTHPNPPPSNSIFPILEPYASTPALVYGHVRVDVYMSAFVVSDASVSRFFLAFAFLQADGTRTYTHEHLPTGNL